jgi:cell division protein FtsZ
MSYQFEIPASNRSIIKVIGVGGGGSNAVNYMYQLGIQDVEFFVCNTDAQALRTSPIPSKIPIGAQLTEGLGAGTNPEMGKAAALEDKERIRQSLENTKMVFVTAGMGGGTGTGAAPIIAKIAKEMDILTVGIVTMPFSFEGRKKIMLAEAGINELKTHCDTVIVILNDKIREIYGQIPMKESFTKSDNILSTAAKSIAEIITNPGFINIDFQDVNMVMKSAGAAVMGSATTSGKDRAIKAAEMALHSPLLNNTDITGAKKILVSITATEESLMMDEFAEINDYFQETAGMEALLKCGVTIDPNMGDNLRVTVIATGFEPTTFSASSKTVVDLDSGRQRSIFDEEPQRTRTQPSYSSPDGYGEPPKVIEVSNGIFSKANESEKVIINLEGKLPEESQPTLFAKPQQNESLVSDYQEIDEDKRKKNEEQYATRITKLSEKTFSNLSNDEFKEMLSEPAYLRKQKQLHEAPHSSERVISKLSLNEDGDVLGNNKFLHDNVD